ncbi:MAG: 23S rRNA (adenine(2503)-C(2))-methyltransferase RlmN [Clostridia bacterium]|nr:23S rRNA (adenine(2503)-C(2))-methyltransferase RlmN [Clostridia bacterium]
MKLNLLDLNPTELKEYITGLGFPGFRAKQVHEWLMRGVESFDEMTNIPAAMRSILDESATTGLLKIRQKLQSQIDETCKYLFCLNDGYIIESVLMKYKYGYSICISSQAGCRMGCKFCASSDIPFSRDLTAGEMLSQILTVNRDKNIKIGHIVIMGIGEPLDNYENVMKFLRNVQDPAGVNISYRKISLSTCGVVPGIYRLAEEDIPITLSISLHNPFDEQRTLIMPINRKYNLDKLIEACNSYIVKSGRRITFEYAMISGVNDSPEHAEKLCSRLKGMLCHVNLIPMNRVSGKSFERSHRKSIEQFSDILSRNGISVTVRRELGRDINAACGQLRKQQMDSD